jgi:hypothetical protein
MEGLREFPLWYAVGLGGVDAALEKGVEVEEEGFFPMNPERY